MKANNILTLGKCAYIFHWSNNTYFYGTAAQRAEKQAINKALKAIHENPDKGVNLPYAVDAAGRVLVEVDGLTIAVNDKMTATASGEHPHGDIINNRTFKSLQPFHESFRPGTFGTLHQYPDNECFWGGDKMKSFEVESFPGSNSLNYYRLHFRRNQVCFIVANGKIYNADRDNYTESTPANILNALQAESKTARKIISALLDYLTA